ncbi:MAG: S41 family peptidase [Candidatus Eremiobacterota bacterium]
MRTLVLLLLLTALARAAPPKVAATEPTTGDRAVDPALHEIRITFDQDMDLRGYSVTGGGPSFPRVDGTPRWDTPRVFVLPVRLEPSHDYVFGVNQGRNQGFRNLAGEPAEAAEFRFATRGGARADATQILEEAIERRYSYRDRVVKDWKGLFDRARPALKAARTPMEFAEVAAAVLKAARDPHLNLQVGEKLVPTYPIDLSPNADPARLAKLVPGWKRQNQQVVTGRWPDGVGYLLIASWTGKEADFVPVHQALDDFQDCRAIVLDLRFNSGGDERHAREVAARFLTGPVVFAKHRTRSGGGWSPVQERSLEPPPAKRRFRGRAVVLMGPRCFSSNESFLLMMRAAGATLVGQPSYGSSGNPQPVDLGNGVVALIPSWEALDAAGKPLEGHGVQPDVKAEVGKTGDGVLEAALKLLATGGCRSRAPTACQPADRGPCRR